jgi:RES domain-containing protein
VGTELAVRVVEVTATNTHRLVDTVFDRDEPVLLPLVDSAEELSELDLLAQATHTRVLAEHQRDPAVPNLALVRGVPGWKVINAAFSNPPGQHNGGGRFNSSTAGAWYAGVDLETAVAEVHFHRERRLVEQTPDLPDTTFTFRAWLADFHTPMAVLHPNVHAALLDADVTTYSVTQTYADRVRETGAGGVVYPSVRRPQGMCIVSFHAALVQNVRKGPTVSMQWRTRDRLTRVSAT